MNVLRKFCCNAMLATFCAALLPVPAQAQVVPSGFESRHAVWVGGECSTFSASFPYQSGQRIYGCGAFADLRWAPHLDVEGDARWLPAGGFAGSTESSYLAGPRYMFNRLGKFQPYGKFLLGEGSIHYPYQIGNRTYFALAPGGGLNYRVARRLTVRAEYEYQIWLNSPGFANEPNHHLAPNGFNLGVAYQVLHF
ncbi:MAG: outer membrane beta-barrel protein [Terracidiphilus sp.]|jgi:opacity protein-like surface antigen